MQFIDSVTPSSPQQYITDARNYSYSHMNDFNKQSAGDWATMYYQNAYNTALLNYQNEYNSPLQQMLRYQEAGINPFLAASDPGNMGSTHAGAAPKGNFVAPSSLDAISKTMSLVTNTVKAATDIYDYLKYGVPTEKQQITNLGLTGENLALQGEALGQQIRKYQAEADWAEYWNNGGVSNPAADSPRAQYMANSVEYKLAQIDQLQALVKVIYPNQAEAAKATAALNNYKKEVLSGQFGTVLDIDTGNTTADGVLQMLLMKLLSTSIGFSGKMF